LAAREGRAAHPARTGGKLGHGPLGIFFSFFLFSATFLKDFF
jgi:hypothetical protein